MMKIQLSQGARAFAFALAVVLTAMTGAAQAAESIGQIKTTSGKVTIERAGKTVDAEVGARVFEADRVVTGRDGSVGITFRDNTVLSAGASSILTFDEFSFDSATLEGSFVSSLDQGSLSIISGDIVARSPEALKVKTPMAILGVRGTEFVVRVDPELDEVSLKQ